MLGCQQPSELTEFIFPAAAREERFSQGGELRVAGLDDVSGGGQTLDLKVTMQLLPCFPPLSAPVIASDSESSV